jgi:phosphatidate cytidylyltransferase
MANPAPGESSNGASARRAGSAGVFGADLRARVGAAVALMAGALASAWAGGYWFASFWLIAALVVHWEWQRLIGGSNQRLRVLCGSAGLAAAAPLAIDQTAAWAIAALLIGAVGAALASGVRPPRLMPGAGVLYAGAMLVAVCLLRASRPDGLYAIIWLFAVVWGTDVMAFFGGRLVGGPKLWPRLSPGKTWSGFGVGVACGGAAGLIAAPAASSSAALFCFGLAIGAVAQGGDLFESALKRRFGVKDSSHLIPGHGGLMDRLDGFAAAAVSTALVGAARYGMANMAGGIFQW